MSDPENTKYLACPHCGRADRLPDFEAVMRTTALSFSERRILRRLWRSNGSYVSNGRVARAIWGVKTKLPLSFKDRGLVATRIHRLRRRLPPYLCVHSIKNLGYRVELRGTEGEVQ